ncbi:MAG: altronate dehydratase family protein [Lachnospiraceae bacterium]|nr:altronate dehydratase family protein [Lachnospiraceae bacterium]
MKEWIRIHNDDNVAVALVLLNKGKHIETGNLSLTLKENIPQGHKFALTSLKTGQHVIKYGASIGVVLSDTSPGSWIHTHNLKTNLGDLLTYSYKPDFNTLPALTPATFQGYRRAYGKVGIRNNIWIIPTNGCVNSIASALEKMSQKYLGEHIDAIVAFPHPYGCSQMGDDQENTRNILSNLVKHPNAGGVLLLGLGCENSNIQVLKPYLGEYDKKRVRFLQVQDVADELSSGLAQIEELVTYARQDRRESISCNELVIGMKCGGSDGLSGITANPTVGAFSDLLIAMGGSTILTEVPEMFGAETLLMNRCETPELFDKTVDLINDFKDYFKAHHQTIYENPSPGNKDGGISTLEDKSLGCTQKSGTASIQGVLSYGEIISAKGLHLLNAPGNDLVASTALAASGAHMVLFTTGRGTPFACPVPTIKISSNTTLATHKSNWIDFNCGSLVEGQTLEELAKQLFDFVLRIAAGQTSKSEEMGFHDMAIFKQGVTL